MTAARVRTRAMVVAVVAAIVLLALVGVEHGPVGAQTTEPATTVGATTEPETTLPPPTNTVIVTTTTTTLAPSTTSTTPVTRPPKPTAGTTPTSTTTTTTIAGAPRPGTDPQGDPAAAGDAPSEAPPEGDFVVPPLPGSPILRGGLGASQLILGELTTAKADLLEAQGVHDTAVARVASLRGRLADSKAAVAQLGAGDQTSVDRYAALQQQMATQAADAYIGSGDPAATASVLLASEDANDFGTRRRYAASVVDGLKDTIDSLRTARRSTKGTLVATAEKQASLSLELIAAVAAEQQSKLRMLTAGFAVQAFGAGSEIFVTGFVFPAADPHNFVDSFGAPREVGNQYAHFHEGTDIMAAAGTPLFACERGVVTKMSSSVLGGNGFWLKGESGTSYYYAHLQSYAPGMAVGRVLDAGTTIGYVGSTGNAAASAPHVHFEIHPNGGAAVNPYPLLKVVDDVGHGRTVTATTTPG